MQRAFPSTQPTGRSRVLPIRGHGLTVHHDGRCVLNAIDLELGATAQITVLLGPNGAGKSLLLRLLAGLLAPSQGTVTWAGLPPDRTRATKIGFVFQRPVLLRRTVAGNIAFALAIAGVPKPERHGRTRDILTESGMQHLADIPAHVLSGGEQQRLAIVRALACQPDIFVLDEPAANLDPASVAMLEKMLRDVRARGIPLVLVTHDLGQARRLADEVIFLHQGRICERTSAHNFFANPASPEAKVFVNGEILL